MVNFLQSRTFEPFIISCPPQVSLQHAVSDVLAVLNDPSQRHVGCVLVVDEYALVGIVTERDLLQWASKNPHFRNLPVAQIMSQPVPTLYREELTDYEVIRRFFQEHPADYLPLINQERAVVGLISRVLFWQALVEERLPLPQPNVGIAPISDQRYREIVETVQEGVLIYNQHGIVTFVNPQLAAMLGYTVTEIIGKPGFAFLNHQEISVAHQKIALRKQSISEQYDFRFVTKTGRELWVLISAKPLQDESGNYVGTLALITDISERKNAELAMQSLVEGTAAVTGQAFFPALVQHLAVCMGVKHTLISELHEGYLHTRAFWTSDQIQNNFSYDPQNAPCQKTLDEGIYVCPTKVQESFPEDPDLVTFGAQSYLGVALKDQMGQNIGVLCVLDNAPLTDIPRLKAILQIFAARGAAEIERVRANEALKHINTELESTVEQRTAALRQSERRLRQYFQQSLVGLSITSPDRGWIEVNDYLLNLLGYSREELFKLTWSQLTHPEDLVGNELIFKRALQGEIDSYSIDKRYIRKDGRVIFTSISTRCVRHVDGSIDYFLTMVQDITERKMAEAEILATNQKLAMMNQALKQATQLKDDFISTVSHELRSPLNNINMAIVMLKLEPDSSRRDAYLQALETECKREIELINDLLDLQRLESGQRKFEAECIEITEWFPNLLGPFLERAISRGQKLKLDIEPTFQYFVSDRNSLERIIVELLNNACKYAPPQGGIIQVEALRKDHQIHIHITNNGPSIPEEALPMIFDKFYRVPSMDPWKQGGTGLGLALVKQLVEELNGTIEVLSEDHETVFTVKLPYLGQDPTDIPGLPPLCEHE